MLSEEEKKAIEFLKMAKKLKIVLSCNFWNNGKFEFNKLQKQQFDIILNLIEKQQKEISLLKDQLEYVKSEYEETIEQQQKKIEELKQENQSLFELYNFNDTNLLVKVLKEYRKEIKKLKKELDNAISKDKIKEKTRNSIEKRKLIELMNKYDYLGDLDFETELYKLLEE